MGFLERLQNRIVSMSPGDRLIAYTLGALVGMASFAGLYALQQSLLVIEPAYGGSLTEGVAGNPRYINPLLTLTDADRDLTTLTYAGLMGLTGTGGLVPVLAEEYEISPDGKTYTFTLRTDTKFSDGSPLTSADIVFTVQKAQDKAIKSPEYANWSGVAVSAPDARTVQFTLSRPYAPFLELTTLGILPERLWKSVPDNQFSFSPLVTNPVGAGPFKIKSVERDTSGVIQSVVLEYNPHFVLGRPFLDRIRLKFFSRSEDLASALTKGDIESAYDLPSPGALTAPYSRVFGIHFNQNEKPVYARAEVRKALSLAIDRTHIVEEVLGGYATAVMGPVPPASSITQVTVPTDEDPTAAAAKVLQDAGWAYDSTARMWKHAAAKQTLDALTIRTSNVPELKGIASVVKADWEKLGVPVSVELYEAGDLLQNILRPRKYEALLYGLVVGRNQDLYAFWHSQERNDPGLNIALYANKTVDTLLEEARSNTDERARVATLQKIEDAVAADYPAAFIYAPDFIYAIPQDLRGVALPQIVTPSDRFAGVASWYRETDAVWPFFTKQQ